jgi:hypothetical protein
MNQPQVKLVLVMAILSIGLPIAGAQESQETKETSPAEFSMGNGEKNWIDVKGATRN